MYRATRPMALMAKEDWVAVRDMPGGGGQQFGMFQEVLQFCCAIIIISSL